MSTRNITKECEKLRVSLYENMGWYNIQAIIGTHSFHLLSPIVTLLLQVKDTFVFVWYV